MAILKNSGRQEPLTAKMAFTFADANGVSVELIDIPGGATIVGGGVAILNAFNSATSASLALGNRTTGTLYATGVNAKATGETALTLGNGPSLASDAVVLNITNTGTPTVGDGYVWVSYIVNGRATEVQPV